jgi:hypothetical protein
VRVLKGEAMTGCWKKCRVDGEGEYLKDMEVILWYSKLLLEASVDGTWLCVLRAKQSARDLTPEIVTLPIITSSMCLLRYSCSAIFHSSQI